MLGSNWRHLTPHANRVETGPGPHFGKATDEHWLGEPIETSMEDTANGQKRQFHCAIRSRHPEGVTRAIQSCRAGCHGRVCWKPVMRRRRSRRSKSFTPQACFGIGSMAKLRNRDFRVRIASMTAAAYQPLLPRLRRCAYATSSGPSSSFSRLPVGRARSDRAKHRLLPSLRKWHSRGAYHCGHLHRRSVSCPMRMLEGRQATTHWRWPT